MEWSKDSIVSRHFSKKVMGGVSEFEVRDFLHVLAEEMRHVRQLNINYKRKLAQQEEQIQDYRDREHILRQSIASAQEVADNIRRDAEKHAQVIVERAKDKSEALIQDARHSLQTVYNDIADLKRLYLQFKTSLRASLQAQMELLEEGPLFTASLPFEGGANPSGGADPLQDFDSQESARGEGREEPREGRIAEKGPAGENQGYEPGRGTAASPARESAAGSDPGWESSDLSASGAAGGAEEKTALHSQKNSSIENHQRENQDSLQVPSHQPGYRASRENRLEDYQNERRRSDYRKNQPASRRAHSQNQENRLSQGNPAPGYSSQPSSQINKRDISRQNPAGKSLADQPARAPARSFEEEHDPELHSLKVSLRSLNKDFF